jgi:hypothetical protein
MSPRRLAVFHLLHIGTDPHTKEQTRGWFALLVIKCRTIALHDTHHPAYDVGAAVPACVAEAGWTVHEYWGDPSGWTVLIGPGGACTDPERSGASHRCVVAGPASLGRAAAGIVNHPERSGASHRYVDLTGGLAPCRSRDPGQA